MSLCHEGLNAKLKPAKISIIVQESAPLIQLANNIDWSYLSGLVLHDLKATTTKGFWWLGRKLFLRIHLAVMILQVLFKLTDRGVEQRIKETPIYQLFCGLKILKKWHCPDHTKIEEFRNRLSEDTHKKMGDYILQLAQSLGFSNPSHLDVDSTVQEANMAYPSDISLMKKLAQKCHKALSYLKEKAEDYLSSDITIDIKSIVKATRKYFFLAKNCAIEKKREVFSEVYRLVKSELKSFIKLSETLPKEVLDQLPWNYQEAIKEVREKAWRYLLDVAHFVRTNTLKPGKILSFKLCAVACIKKGKLGKDNEFGRVFQVGRIGGNFIVPYTCTSVRMNDKESLSSIIEEHQEIFGEGILESVTTDKGYYSKNNVNFIKEVVGDANGIQRPSTVKDQVEVPQKEELYNRRSGVEPLIGHVKKFGLGKSKMKSDGATLTSGYRSAMGFNLHQLMRYLGDTPPMREAEVR